MASTKNGYYYPNDYNALADIPEDMKKAAEAADKIIEPIKTDIKNLQTDNSKNQKDISTLKDNQQTSIYRVVINEEIESDTEYELPCKYIVGNDSLTILYCNERLICEKKPLDGNYAEVGEKGQASNKVKFGWNVKPGRIFDFIVKGVVEDV